MLLTTASGGQTTDPQDELQPIFLCTLVVKACSIIVPPEKHNSEDTAHRPSSVLQH